MSVTTRLMTKKQEMAATGNLDSKKLDDLLTKMDALLEAKNDMLTKLNKLEKIQGSLVKDVDGLKEGLQQSQQKIEEKADRTEVDKLRQKIEDLENRSKQLMAEVIANFISKRRNRSSGSEGEEANEPKKPRNTVHENESQIAEGEEDQESCLRKLLLTDEQESTNPNDPIISRLGELKLGKQEDIMKSCPTTDKEDSDSEFSSESDKGSINDGEHCGATDHSNKAEASVELKGEFLKAVMDEDYEKAKELCHKLLLLEPDNKICSEFHAVIVEKMQQDAADEDEESGDDDDDSSSTESSESGEEDEGQESDDKNSEDDDDSDNESDSDDDYTPLSGPINLIVGGLPIRPQSR
ncbi:hypothetical protein ACROYT_G025482 [Oculina patagonica]